MLVTVLTNVKSFSFKIMKNLRITADFLRPSVASTHEIIHTKEMVNSTESKGATTEENVTQNNAEDMNNTAKMANSSTHDDTEIEKEEKNEDIRIPETPTTPRHDGPTRKTSSSKDVEEDNQAKVIIPTTTSNQDQSTKKRNERKSYEDDNQSVDTAITFASEGSKSVVDMKKASEEKSSNDPVYLKKELGLLEGVTMIMSIVIGSGIFVAPKGVITIVGSVGLSLVVWLLSGIVSLLGALSYAELGKSHFFVFSFMIMCFI